MAWLFARVSPQRLLTLTTISMPHPDAWAEVAGDPRSGQFAASSYIADFIAEGAEARLLDNDAAALRALYQGLPAERVGHYLAHFREPGALTAGLNWYRANLAMPAPILGTVSVPTMHIWSDSDPSFCIDGAERTAKYVLAPYRFEQIAGVGHWVPEMAPDAVNQRLLSHFATQVE